MIGKSTGGLPNLLKGRRQHASQGFISRMVLQVMIAVLLAGSTAAVHGLVQPSSVAEAHTVQIALRVESNCDVTWFAGTYHGDPGLFGSIIIDGTSYAFAGSLAALPSDVDGSVSATGAPPPVKWQTVTVSGLAAGTHSVSTTATSSIEDPWPSFAPTVELGDCTTTFNWTGFFKPIDNPPLVNSVRAGSAIPIKFSLDGDQGLDIFAEGYPKSVLIPCDGGTASDDTPTVNAGASSLSYDPSTDQYTYVWKSEASWAGTCRQLQVELVDGTVHTANFQFK